MHKTIAIAGALNALLAIVLGAFLAHALDTILSESMRAVFNTAVDYHTWHALALILLALSYSHIENKRLILTSALLMMLGIVLFCGSLYLLAISGLTKLGIITPFGGVSFILSWIIYAWGILKTPRKYA